MRTICNNSTIQDKRESKFVALVEKVFNEHNQPQGYRGTIASMLRELFSKTSKTKHVWKRETLRRLLLHLHREKCYKVLQSRDYVMVLLHMSSFGDRITVVIEDWKKEGHDPETHLSSLIRFCFATYEVPVFLERAFFEDQIKYRLWYVQLGKGKSVKSLKGMPIALTSKMAHEFRSVPKGLTVSRGLRYAQARGYGATKVKAMFIAQLPLSRTNFEDEVFWSKVVMLFVRNEAVDYQNSCLIIDYLTHMRREDSNYSVKGRTVNALKQQSERWHRNVHLEYRVKNGLHWKPSGIQNLFKEVEENGEKVIYKTVELCSSIDLYREGLEMEHCVATYDKACYEGESAIFSLQRFVAEAAPERLATIEVCLEEKKIIQEQGKYNSRPTDHAYLLMKQWMREASFFKTTPVVHDVKQIQQAYEIGYGREVSIAQEETIDYMLWVRVIGFLAYIIIKIIRLSF